MMREGLLWYDDDPTSDLADKVRRAAKRYQQKYGTQPGICYVHPSAISQADAEAEVNGVHVDSLVSVLRHHFWLGQEDKASPGRSAASWQ